MIHIPRWWLAVVYFVSFTGMLGATIDMADAGWPKWIIAFQGASAAMFFIGFAVHTGKLLLNGWRSFMEWRA